MSAELSHEKFAKLGIFSRGVACQEVNVKLRPRILAQAMLVTDLCGFSLLMLYHSGLSADVVCIFVMAILACFGGGTVAHLTSGLFILYSVAGRR